MHPTLSSLLSRWLIDRKNSHRRAVLAAFEEKTRLATCAQEEQVAWRDQRLADLLNHARAHVPHFRALWGDLGVIHASNAREVLASLPVMTRAEIQAAPAEFSAPGMAYIDDATGGSSGTPMTFRVDRATQIARESSLYWADSLAGWRYGDRIAMLWGSDKDNRSAAADAKLAFRWWIDNRRWFNAFNMGEEQMAAFHRAMNRFRPHIIVAYAGSLDVYARFLESMGDGQGTIADGRKTMGKGQKGIDEQNLSLAPRPLPIANCKSVGYPLTALIASAEMLTPRARETAERVFGKPVFNRYGSREFGALAAEDGGGQGLRINPSDCILEVDSTDPVNLPGPLLVTYLANHAMPFIRYNTGDLACMSADGTRILSLAGRESDTIRTASGKMIHGEYFTHLLYRAKYVREFQFIQETLSRYRLLLVAQQPESKTIEDSIREDIYEELGANISLELEYVEQIPVLSSGKRKFTISKIAP